MNQKFLDMLTRLAIENPGVKGKFKLAAGVVYKNHLVATGVNSKKSHPLMGKFGKNENSIFLHAEVDAIKNALRVVTQEQLSKCDLYVVRVKKNGGKYVHGLAKPCAGCARAISAFEIQNVYYTEDEQCSK